MVRGLVDTKSMVTKREEHGEEPGVRHSDSPERRRDPWAVVVERRVPSGLVSSAGKCKFHHDAT